MRVQPQTQYQDTGCILILGQITVFYGHPAQEAPSLLMKRGLRRNKRQSACATGAESDIDIKQRFRAGESLKTGILPSLQPML